MAKRTSLFQKKEISQVNTEINGLAVTTIGELVEKDTDGDTIPDWQEPLYGLDPTKKETVPGIPDITTINKLRVEQGGNMAGEGEENLTQTDKFSQQLFSTIAALNQSGVVDQTTVDQISNSLVEQIKNPVIRKVFLASDIKVIQDNSAKALKTYRDAMLSIQNKYPDKGNVIDVLQKFIVDENNVDASVLAELDPIIDQTQNIINAMLKTNVPSSLAQLHLDFINAGERLMENTIDIKLYENDPIIAMGAISKYIDNLDLFQSTLIALAGAINQKLNN